MRQRRSAGQFRRRVDLAAAIGNGQRLADMGAEGGEILDRQRAAARLHVGGDAARQIALVEIARALCGELRQRRLQLCPAAAARWT